MKEFILNGEEFGQLCRVQLVNGPLAIDIGGELLTNSQAKRLIKWIEAALVKIKADEKSRKIYYSRSGGKKTIVVGAR